MDRNQAIGLVLIAGILITYSLVFKPPTPEEPITTGDTTSVTTPAEESLIQPIEQQAAPTVNRDSLLDSQYGAFASAMSGTEETFIIETEKAKYNFSTKGGSIQSVELKDYLTHTKEPLILFDESSNRQQLQIGTTNGVVDLTTLTYSTNQGAQTLQSGDSTVVKFVATLADGSNVEQSYTIFNDKYDLKYSIKLNGMQNKVLTNEMTIVWEDNMKRFEYNLDDARNKATLRYYTFEDGSDNLKAISNDPQQETVGEGIKWASFSQHFFNAGIIAEKGFSSGIFASTPVADTSHVELGKMELKVPMSDLYAGANFSYYYGPNSYKVLRKVTDGYEDNVYMGYKLVSWVNKLIIVQLFSFLEQHIANYGIIIIIIVLIIKLALFPLSRKSYLSMAKMKVLKPELDALKEKTGGDMQAQQQEQMKLYREMGVNPISGCIPLVLQMPFLFAMFFFFPNSIELRGESFLWAHDLSTYDVLINLPFTIPFYGDHVSGFTLLMTLSTLAITWSNNQVSSVQGPMKNIGYFMPIIFMFVLNSYSAGLSFYYFVSNLVTFGQQTLIRRFVDEDKIRNQLMENKKKAGTKGKSKFQQRLEDAMKASQEAQRQKQNKKKK
ncbi:MAG: membrane protein insertase YidC [Cytophagia bacterium]|nr:membrane protein insertase YidC [Cytophagia bacterium]